MMKSVRLSNIELLRILSMFGILVLHANFNALGLPSAADASAAPFPTFFRLLTGCLVYGSVNVFVLISGWFGIRPKAKSLAAFVFQALFFSVGVYAVLLLLGQTELHQRGVAECFWATPDSYWFVKAYLILYLFAPALNNFAENASRRSFKMLLIGFFAFQTFYSGLVPGEDWADFFMRGYSPVSFFGLYLLARYIRIHRPRFSRFSFRTDLSLWLGVCALSAAWSFLCLQFGIPGAYLFLKYTSPVVIAASVLLLMAFSKLHFQSRVVNEVALSCFAVYLFHCNVDVIINYFLATSKDIFLRYDGGVYLFHILAFLVAVFLVSILIDRVRLFCWKCLENKIRTKKCR